MRDPTKRRGGLTGDAVKDVGSRFPLRKAVEESAEPRPRLLDDLHPLLDLEVPEVLFPYPALLPHPDNPPPAESPAHLPQRRPRPLVRRHVEKHPPVRRAGDQPPEADPSLPGL